MSEKLVKVTSFSELRTGMIVVLSPCTRCSSKHRMMLLSQYAAGTFTIQGRSGIHQSAHFDATPTPHGYRVWAVSTKDVDEDSVWRVVDGLESPAATTRTKRPLTTKGQ